MAAEPAEIFAQRPPLRLVEPTGPGGYDGDLGYTLVRAEEGEHLYSPNNLLHFPLPYARGLGKAASHLFNHHLGHATSAQWPIPERKIIAVNGHNRSVLVTEPDPNMDVRSDEAWNEVISVGLSEMDIASALLYHIAMAKGFRDRRTITLTTPGMNVSGPTLSLHEGLTRPLEVTAQDHLDTLQEIANDGPIHMGGVSLGTPITLLAADLNMAANNGSQLNIVGVRLVSPAVGARNVDEHERFSEADADDREFIADVTDRWAKHMPGDIGRMALRHPEIAGECMAILGAYGLAPHKLPARVATIYGNLKSAQKGIEWSAIKRVAGGHHFYVVGGADDPLVQEQLNQWRAVKKLAPHAQIRILENYGHALSLDGAGTVKQLSQMELEATT